MFGKIKKFFQSKDDRMLTEAEEHFDKLMAKIDEDELVLEKLEKHVREEFKGLEGDVQKLSQELDGVVV